MPRYVVCAYSENHALIYGTFSDVARANAMAVKINAAVEREQETAQAEWQERYRRGEVSYTYGSPEEQMPEYMGGAYVATIRKPRLREAIRFALTGNPDE